MKVELVTEKGDELVANAARASFNRTFELYTDEQNQKLLNFLARAEPAHFIPYCHARYRFLLDKKAIDWFNLTPDNRAGLDFTSINETVAVEHSLWGWVNLIKEGKINQEVGNSLINWFCEQEELKQSVVALELEPVPCSKEAYFLGRGDSKTLRITCPIVIARQFFKSVVGFVYSEASGRYIDYESIFLPDTWYSAPDNRKQGSGEPLREDLQVSATALAKYAYKTSESIYESLKAMGVAPEQARYVMPLATNTTFVVTGSKKGWERFLGLRLEQTAQKEIQALAQLVKEVL